MSGTDADVAEYRRSLWTEVARHLSAAAHSVELAQGVLEDLDRSEWADLLQPMVDQLRTARTEAEGAEP